MRNVSEIGVPAVISKTEKDRLTVFHKNFLTSRLFGSYEGILNNSIAQALGLALLTATLYPLARRLY